MPEQTQIGKLILHLPADLPETLRSATLDWCQRLWPAMTRYAFEHGQVQEGADEEEGSAALAGLAAVWTGQAAMEIARRMQQSQAGPQPIVVQPQINITMPEPKIERLEVQAQITQPEKRIEISKDLEGRTIGKIKPVN